MSNSAAPRLLVEGFECLTGPAFPARRSLGMLDLSSPISEALLFRRIASPAPKSISVGLFASALDREVATIAWEGRLAIPGLAASIDGFLREIGGLAGIRGFRRHLKVVDTATTALKRAEEIRDLVAAAACVPPSEVGEGGMVYCHLGHGEAEFVHDAAEAYSSWQFDAYAKRHPRPDVDFDAPEYQAWSEAYRTWVRAEKPPMVFLTTPIHFAGLDATTIRQAFEDEGEVDLPGLLTSACDDHHEDAFEQLVAEDDLFALIAGWLPHAGKGTPEDFALETELAAWNGRQTLVSYMLDPSRYTGTAADVDAAEIARWCAQHVDRANASLEAAGIWAPSAPGAEDAPAPRAA